MAYNSIVISSGHGKYVRGASGNPGLDEVDEARIFVDLLGNELRDRGVAVKTYHDDVSKSQDENLHRIVDFHNAQSRELDISVHFNAFDTMAHGTEVCYVTQEALAEELSEAIATAGGFINRGPKYRDGLYFLNQTSAPSVLLEICFCDSTADCELYKQNFPLIAEAVADVLTDGEREDEEDPPPVFERPSRPGKPKPPAKPPVAAKPPASKPNIQTGTCSHFGGKDDTGVSPSEGLAFIYDIDEENQFLFTPFQPENTSGLARRLNTEVAYCAMRWDYEIYPKDTLLLLRALVRNPKTGFAIECIPADWGPHEEKTGRLIDLSPVVMRNLQLQTDDMVEVEFPYSGPATS